MTVYLLVIEHRHGEDISVCADEKVALDELDKYIQENWESEMEGDMPETPEGRESQYFDVAIWDMKGSDPESYYIEERDVLDAAHSQTTAPQEVPEV